MDIEEKDDRLEKLKQALATFDSSPPSPEPQSAYTWDTFDISSIPSLTTIDLSQLNSATMGSLSPNVSLSGNASAVWAVGGGGGAGGLHVSPSTTTTISGGPWTNGKVKIDASDVEINGKNLMTTLERIETQLGILDCDEILEQEWADLRDLGKQYRKKKMHIEEKMKTFETLKR
jgi:hypothetical protein